MAERPSKPVQEAQPVAENFLTAFRADTATPEEADRMIDARIQALQTRANEKRAELEALTEEIKRWGEVRGGKVPDARTLKPKDNGTTERGDG